MNTVDDSFHHGLRNSASNMLSLREARRDLPVSISSRRSPGVAPRPEEPYRRSVQGRYAAAPPRQIPEGGLGRKEAGFALIAEESHRVRDYVLKTRGKSSRAPMKAVLNPWASKSRGHSSAFWGPWTSITALLTVLRLLSPPLRAAHSAPSMSIRSRVGSTPSSSIRSSRATTFTLPPLPSSACAETP